MNSAPPSSQNSKWYIYIKYYRRLLTQQLFISPQQHFFLFCSLSPLLFLFSPSHFILSIFLFSLLSCRAVINRASPDSPSTSSLDHQFIIDAHIAARLVRNSRAFIKYIVGAMFIYMYVYYRKVTCMKMEREREIEGYSSLRFVQLVHIISA